MKSLGNGRKAHLYANILSQSRNPVHFMRRLQARKMETGKHVQTKDIRTPGAKRR